MQSPRGFFLPSFKEYKGFKEETKWHLIDKTYWWVCKSKIQGHDIMEFPDIKLNFFTDIVQMPFKPVSCVIWTHFLKAKNVNLRDEINARTALE